MELIDRLALGEKMYHEAFESDTDMQRWDGGCWIRYKMFENAVKDAPIIEAVPVVHGEWVEENRRPRLTQFVCSVCHMTAYDPQPTRDPKWVKRCRYAYCPNCGASMDGGRKA